jgi:hypothetical protein
VIGLLQTGSGLSLGLGLGPLEGIVPADLARRAAKALPSSLALKRLAGQTAGLRQSLRRTTAGTSSLATLLQRGFEAWAAGLTTEANHALALATSTLTLPTRGPHAGFGPRCQLIRLTRLVQGRAAAYRLMSRLSRPDPRFRHHLVERLLARQELAAALGLARPGHDRQIIARLRMVGQLLARWGVARDPALRQRWAGRYGSKLARRAWQHVAAGSQAPRSKTPSALEKVLRLVGQGRLTEAETAAKTAAEAVARQRRPRGRRSSRILLWQARIAHLRGNGQTVLRRLRRLRHQDPGGFRWLPMVLPSLSRLGQHRAAGRLADALYERSLTDPSLLGLVARGAVAAGRYDKAELALTDWASQTGRPDRAYLAVSRWLAARGQWNRAAALSSRAIGWSGARPLGPTLATLRHQWAARRTGEARRTAAWLLARWPAGNARNGISQTIAASLLAADRLDAARPYLTLKRGLDLKALLRRRRFAEVLGRVAARARSEPLAGSWPALAALAAQGQKQWTVAARYVDQVALRNPRSGPLARALLLADQGRILPALAALAPTYLTLKNRAPRIAWLAAALAARAGKRRLAARLLSRGIVTLPWTRHGATAQDLALMRPLAMLPLEIPWDMLLAAPIGAGSCEP